MSQSVSPESLPGRLAGQVAIITGGGGGIGGATSRRLAADGAFVAVFDINESSANTVADSVRAEGGRARAWRVDVTDRNSVSGAVAAVESECGGIDILVNNAGLARQASFLELKDEDWNFILNLNLTGYFIVGQEAARAMVRRGAGRIVNVSSLAAHYAAGKQAVYAAAKGGVIALTQVMAFELAPLGISVNAISPGPVATEMSARNMSAQSRQARLDRIPQGRLGTPEDMANAIAFLASPDAAYVNGTTLIVDGGLLRAGIRE